MLRRFGNGSVHKWDDLLPCEVSVIATEVTVGCSAGVPVVSATVQVQVAGDHSCRYATCFRTRATSVGQVGECMDLSELDACLLAATRQVPGSNLNDNED